MPVAFQEPRYKYLGELDTCNRQYSVIVETLGAFAVL